MLGENRKCILDRILQGKNTNYLADALIHAELLNAYKHDREAYDYIRKIILEKRRNWLTWRILTQNNWQIKGVNHHHDSFEIRESYIAPHAIHSQESEFKNRARQYNKRRMPSLYKRFNREAE